MPYRERSQVPIPKHEWVVMDAEWNPAISRSTVPGASAHSLARTESWALGICLASLVVAVPLWASRLDLWSFPFYIVSVLALAVKRTADSMERAAVAREAKAGYTTLKSGPPDVDYVDSRTGRLVRYANEVVAPEEVDERLQAVRRTRTSPTAEHGG
nr:hypothetical protein GCM10025730_40800 [Promicromonospora thailandica]